MKRECNHCGCTTGMKTRSRQTHRTKEKTPMASTNVKVRETDGGLMEAIAKAQGQMERTPEQASADIARRILESKTADEVLAESTTLSSDDVLNKSITVLGVSYNKSTFEGEGSSDAYAVVSAVVPATGELLAFTVGGNTVLAQLVKLQALDAFPLTVTLRQKATPTARGYYPLYLTKG
jgi:hypothetical protein